MTYCRNSGDGTPGAEGIASEQAEGYHFAQSPARNPQILNER
jgi:hypothetical protein